MKSISPVLAVLLAGIVLLVAGYIAFWSLFFSGCGGNEDAARRMRQLSQHRLESIYHFTKQQFKNGSVRSPVIFALKEVPVPNELADLEPKSIQFFGFAVGIHVSGCMDDKVFLIVEGLDQKFGDPKIVLSPGENQATEVLWQQ